MKSLNIYLKEDYIRRFIRAAKILVEHEPCISIQDLLSKHKVIKPIRAPRPSIEEIEAAGYRHDGKGNIMNRHGRILKGSRAKDNRNHNAKYKNHNLRVKGYGRKDAPRYNQGEWTSRAHVLIFAFVHRRWPMDGMLIDHIDGDSGNNHPDNLREVNYIENNWKNKLKEQDIIKPIKTNSIDTHPNLLDFLDNGTI